MRVDRMRGERMQVINPDEAVLVVGEEAVPVGEEVEMVDD